MNALILFAQQNKFGEQPNAGGGGDAVAGMMGIFMCLYGVIIIASIVIHIMFLLSLSKCLKEFLALFRISTNAFGSAFAWNATSYISHSRSTWSSNAEVLSADRFIFPRISSAAPARVTVGMRSVPSMYSAMAQKSCASAISSFVRTTYISGSE